MTGRVKNEMLAEMTARFPNNESEEISFSDLQSVFGDMVDSCFRGDALYLEAGDGRLLDEQATGYLTKDFAIIPDLPTGAVFHVKADDITTMTNNSDVQAVTSDGDTFQRWQDVADSTVLSAWRCTSSMTYRADVNGFPAVNVKPVAKSYDSGGSLYNPVLRASNHRCTVIAVVGVPEGEEGQFFRAFTTFDGSLGAFMIYGSNQFPASPEPERGVLQTSPTIGGSYILNAGLDYMGPTGPLFVAGVCREDLNTMTLYNTDGTEYASRSFFGENARTSGAAALGSSLNITGGGATEHYIHEIIGWDTELSESQLSDACRNLAAKYGL